MILINFQETQDKKSGIPISICIGDKPVSKIYTNINQNRACVYSNFQLENAAVHIYNQNNYSNNNIQESSKTNGSGTNGKFRYTGLDTSKTLDFIGVSNQNYRSAAINSYDSLLYTASATNDTRYWNPSFGDGNARLLYIDTSSDGGYKRPLPDLIYKHSDSTGIAEWPHPILLNTNGGTTVEFSKDSQYTNKVTKTASGRTTFIYNLVPNTHYYYRVLNGNTIVKSGELTTEGQIRMIKLDNVLNVRDLGGATSANNKRMFKYDKVFRGAQLEQQIQGDRYFTQGSFTEADAYELKTNLKIDKEIDLRSITLPLAADAHLFLDYSSNDDLEVALTKGLISPGKGESFLNYYKILNTASSGITGFQMFLIFLRALLLSNGAIFVHCQEGRDRTGTVCALLYGICGISGNHILKDYELTTFWGGNESTRYKLLYWEWADSGRESGTSGWAKRYFIETLRQQCSSTSTTISEIIQDWFIYNYDALSDDTYKLRYDNNSVISTGDIAVQFVQSKLLESLDPNDPIIPVTPPDPVDPDPIEPDPIEPDPDEPTDNYIIVQESNNLIITRAPASQNETNLTIL